MNRLVVSCLLLAACSSPAPVPTRPAPVPEPITPVTPAPVEPAEPVPPVAALKPHVVKSPHGDRVDPYYWLRDDSRKDPAMLAYLEAENAYTAAMLAPVKQLEDTLFAEMRSRVKEDDASVPVLDDGYWYYRRYETGKQYPIFARKALPRSGPGATPEPLEEVILDGNQLAIGHAFYRIGNYNVSRDGKLVAWADDTVGRNQYTLHVKELATGRVLPDTATNVSPSFAWANDNKTLFFTGKDPNTLREDRVFRLVLGGQAQQIFKEDDAQYYVGVSTTKSKRYIVIGLGATESSEYRLIDADRPATAPQVYIPRAHGHLYEIDHLDNRFVILTNADAKNFRLVEVAPGKQNDRRAWKDVVPHRADTLVEDVALYHGFIAVSVRTGGLRKVQVLPAKQAAFYIDAQDPAYTMSVIDTPDAKATRVRYAYDSPTTPSTVYELDLATRGRKLLKQDPVPGYDPSRYAAQYLHATAPDGTKVPISIVYRKDTKLDGTAPLLVYGYGAYGSSTDPEFIQTRVSLLDRGWVSASAHIRGGQEMGRAWYEDGRQLNKMNTFTDFIAVTEHLVANNYGARDKVFAFGGSAGGLLVGVIANLRPDLYRGIVSFVPFVDAVTTMLDETIPLTTNEYDEWGNPSKDKAAYDYILAYSPYDNVKRQAYPSMYVKTGLWDSQVQYYEPAKWVAKLRAMKTDGNPIVFDINMSAGHGGASGRFDQLRETARATAFALHVLTRPDRRPADRAP